MLQLDVSASKSCNIKLGARGLAFFGRFTMLIVEKQMYLPQHIQKAELDIKILSWPYCFAKAAEKAAAKA